MNEFKIAFKICCSLPSTCPTLNVIKISVTGVREEDAAKDGNFAVKKKTKKCVSVYAVRKGDQSAVKLLKVKGCSTGFGLEMIMV